MIATQFSHTIWHLALVVCQRIGSTPYTRNSSKSDQFRFMDKGNVLPAGGLLNKYHRVPQDTENQNHFNENIVQLQDEQGIIN